jgi:hypothetical protein
VLSQFTEVSTPTSLFGFAVNGSGKRSNDIEQRRRGTDIDAEPLQTFREVRRARRKRYLCQQPKRVLNSGIISSVLEGMVCGLGTGAGNLSNGRSCG